MIDTDKYEGHDLAKGRVGSDYNIYDRKGNIIFDADDVGSNMATLHLMADAPLLLEEVKRLREELSKAEQERDKYLGALDSAIEQIGYTGMGIDYEERMREDAGITVYGDEYLRCDCEGCSGLVKDKYDDYIIKGRGDQESVKCDFDECPYFYGDEEE